MKVNQYIDHTKLGPTITKEDVKKLVEEAKKYQFFSVCVNTVWVEYAKELTKGSGVKVATVIGFPHGTHTPATKAFETKEAIKLGADEIDMVINVAALKSGDDKLILEEIKGVVDAAKGNVVKVIIETCYLTESEKISACKISVAAHADFVKTSTGFGTGGATFEDVKLMLDTVERKAKVKASGGVRDAETAKRYIEMGVMRLGTSNGISIVKE